MLNSTEMIKTKSFELAIYKKGSIESEKIALVLPGRLDTKDYPHMKSHVELLSDKGYLAISFDPPGTWESKGDISTYNMTNYLKAIEEIIQYYGSKPAFVLGHSRGGSMAILAGTRLKQVKSFMAVMSGATFSDYQASESWIKNGYAISKRDTPSEYEENFKEFKLPISFVEDSLQYDMIEDLKNCKKPKCFVAGIKDDIVELEEIKEYFEVCSEPKIFESIDSDHDYRKSEDRIQIVNKLVENFLKEINP